VGVDARPELDGAALPGAELLLERGDLLGAERVGGSDHGGHIAALGGGDGPERADRRGELAGSPVLRQHDKEVAGQRVVFELFTEAGEYAAERFAADRGVAHQRTQLGRFAEGGGQLFEVALDDGDLAGLARQLEQRSGVTPGKAGLDICGKLHARGSLGERNVRFRAGCWEAPRQSWRAPSIGSQAMQAGWDRDLSRGRSVTDLRPGGRRASVHEPLVRPLWQQ